MQRAPTPENEHNRLQVLIELGVLDSEPDDWLDRITAYCRSRFNVQICLVSLVDADRQWFMSASGLSVRETPRTMSFCGHAVADDRMLVVPDATQDNRFADNPLVTRSPYVRFYAGSPVRVKGQPIGTLCIIDRSARGLNTEDAADLTEIADAVSWYLDHRRRDTTAESAPSPELSSSTTPESDDRSDPWQAAATYLAMHPNTLETRMLAQIAIGFPGSGRDRTIFPWEETMLSPDALGIAHRMLEARKRSLGAGGMSAPAIEDSGDDAVDSHDTRKADNDDPATARDQ